MKIKADKTITVEPTPPQVFDALWIYTLQINAPSVESGRAKFEFLPYDYDNKIIGSGKDVVTLQVDDLWKCVSEVPQVAQVFGAILNSIEPVKAWLKAEEERKEAERKLALTPALSSLANPSLSSN